MAVLLVDLSNNNGPVDFARLARLPSLVGVYLKASEGETFKDRTFAARRDAANRVGLRVGAYHFGRRENPRKEAANFASMVGRLERRDLRPALDAEVAESHLWEAWSREWNGLVRGMLGCLPIFYSYPSWLDTLHASTPIGAGLWLASYGRNDGKEYPYRVPAPWRKAVAHQFTSNGRVPGVMEPADVSSAPLIGPLLVHPIAGRI